MKNKFLQTGLLSLGLCLFFTQVYAQQDFSNVEIKTAQLADNLYMMTGAGGNMAISIGDDGVFLIDDQFAPLSEKIMAAIGKLTDKPVTYLVNTHWHGDHTGGNENFGKSGATIVAHNNVRERMSTKQVMKVFDHTVEPAPAVALPVVTFSKDVNFHFNGLAIQVLHVDPAHTDGDSIVIFGDSNVVHMGDTFFNGFFPFIDGGSGGSVAGVIAAGEMVLAMVDDDTKIIPGHGPLANKADLQNYVTMLKTAQSSISTLIDQGKAKKDIMAADPLGEFTDEWGGGFLNAEKFTSIAHDVIRENK